MKEHIHSDEFEKLANKGWNDLSAKLDRELPLPNGPINDFPFRKVAVVLALLFGVLLMSVILSRPKTHSPSFQPVPKIVNHISFDVQSPDIVVNLLEPSAPTSLAGKNPVFAINAKDATNVESYTFLAPNRPKTEVIGLQYNNFSKYTPQLPRVQGSVTSNVVADMSTNQTQVNLKKLNSKDRHVRLGVNLNSATHGALQSASIGGGISVSFPIGKKFRMEPGVGYDLMRFSEIPIPNDGTEFSLARAVKATPSLNVKYRVRKSIMMPLSIHYQPIRQLALTGGVDVGLLISQRMVFESTNSYSGFDSYKKQLNQGELNQLNRVNIGAHGGVSWFPTNTWKLGLYYGQNLTSEKKLKQQKLKFSNHIFKVRMARYF